MKTAILSFRRLFLNSRRQPGIFKKTWLLLLLSFISVTALSQVQKAGAGSEWRCRTFNVVIGCCGVSVTTDVIVCCGCISHGRCGCTVSKTAVEKPYDGYMVVDHILNNKALTSKTLSVRGSDIVYDKETNLTHMIIPGDYTIQRSEDGYKYIIVKVAVQQE